MTDPGQDVTSLVKERRSGTSIIARLKETPASLITTLETVLHETKTRRAFEGFCRVAAELIFAAWAAKFGHERAILDKERERYIVNRLKENGGEVSELLYALDGAAKDEWVMGTARNARHRNDGILYLFASRERVEQFAEACRGYREEMPHPLKVKYLGDVDVSAISA